MATDRRFVIDTGVILSAALLRQSVPRQALDYALSAGTLLVSEATVTELNDVLRRPGFDKYVTEEERVQFIAAIVRDAELIAVTAFCDECRDPKDNKFLELAVSGQASFIVSGDRDLVVLDPFRGIRIATPRDFLTLALEA